jgi:4-hydroxy-3-methylbut-2-enyl diphosphate reductase
MPPPSESQIQNPKSKILLADTLGFCFGVRRAIELAEAARAAGGAVTTLGPLVHNPQETGRLAEAGIPSAKQPEEIAVGTAVIRAHGARPEVFAALQAQGLRVVDATCPFVTKSQRIARGLARDGYTVVIVGHPDHPEVQGILGYAGEPSFVVSTPDEVNALPTSIRPGVIAQTTMPERTFLDVAAAITARYPDHAVHNTVCSATRERQESARRLAAEVDVLYIVGGRDSSNTNRLAEICRAVRPRTRLIETADEIDPADLIDAPRIGVAAGASTPNWLIEQVVARLEELG